MVGRLLWAGVILGLLDLYLLYRIGCAVGFWPVVAILFLPGYFGLRVVLRQGLQCASRIGEELSSGRNPSQKVAETSLAFLAGLLLLIPGPLSSALGLLLMVPGIRRFVAARFVLRVPRASTIDADGPGAQDSVFVRVVQIGDAPTGTPPVKDAEGREVADSSADRPLALPGPGANDTAESP